MARWRWYVIVAVIGGGLSVAVEHGLLRWLRGPMEVVEVTEPFKVTVNDQLVASVGAGTRAEMIHEGSVYWLTIHVSFAEGNPPFRVVGGKANPEGEVRLERSAP